MKYPLVITRRAELEMLDVARWWALERSAEQASRWLSGLEQELQSLVQSPTRCPLAFEHGQVSFELRELHYGLGRRPTHRAVFTIRGDQVFVLAIRHVAQDQLSADELKNGP